MNKKIIAILILLCVCSCFLIGCNKIPSDIDEAKSKMTKADYMVTILAKLPSDATKNGMDSALFALKYDPSDAKTTDYIFVAYFDTAENAKNYATEIKDIMYSYLPAVTESDLENMSVDINDNCLYFGTKNAVKLFAK